MTRILLLFFLLIQGIPQQQGGSVTGVLRDGQGKPVAGIRMAAVARSDNLEDLLTGASMAGIAETDTEGRFTLENIPPGRYVIAAGRLDLQTYYPGTQSATAATIVTITAGNTISGINFVLNDTSLGRAPGGTMAVRLPIIARIPVQVTVENKGKLPISAGGNYVSIHLYSNAPNPETIPIDGNLFGVPGPAPGNYRVRVEGLPSPYAVKSITYGSTDITRGGFQLTAANFPTATASASATIAAATPPSTISITLASGPVTRLEGVRVSGRIGGVGRHLITMSGRPGVVFSDGTFEFYGVQRGTHLITTVNNPRSPRANLVVVGEGDLDGIELREAFLLPDNARIPREPLPVRGRTPGSTVPFARLSGTVLEEIGRTAIGEGRVVIQAGGASRELPIGADGRFDSLSLLPGSYDLHLDIFGHSRSNQTITVEDKDLAVEVTASRLY